LLIGNLAAVVIENEKLRITILAGRGADVVEYLFKPRDLDFVWLTTTGVRGNALPDIPSDDVDSFLGEYPGGWQTIFPNGGPPSQYRGITFGQHAEVAVLPWSYEILEDTPTKSSVRFTVFTTKVPFKVEKTFSIGSQSGKCEIEERITNLSDQSHETMWGAHITFGPPFLGSDSRVTVAEPAIVVPHHYENSQPMRRVGSSKNFSWPIGGDTAGRAIDFSHLPPPGTPSEMLYLTKMPSGWYRVDTPSKSMAAEVRWDASLFPYLWYWQEYGHSKEAPWFGNHYNIGLEPFSSFPTDGIAKAINNGSALAFAPYAEKVQNYSFEVFEI
jgi:hypothetical protein